MTHPSRSPLWKIIIICLSIALGVAVASKLFKKAKQDSAEPKERDTIESLRAILGEERFDILEEKALKELAPSLANIAIKTHQDIENSIASMSEQERKEFIQKHKQQTQVKNIEDIESLPIEKIDEVKAMLAGMSKEERQEYYKKAEANLVNTIQDMQQKRDRARAFRQDLKERFKTEAELKEWYKTNKFPSDEELITWYETHQKKQETTKPASKIPAQQQATEKPQDKTPAPAVKKIAAPKPVTKAAEPAKPVEPKITPKPAPQDATKSTVTVTNNIQKKMTGYRKFGKTWYPDDYSLTVNGVQVPEGGQIAVPAGSGNTVNLVFAYDFRPMGKSYKKGTEELSYKLSDDTKAVAVTFSWYEKPTLMVK